MTTKTSPIICVNNFSQNKNGDFLEKSKVSRQKNSEKEKQQLIEKRSYGRYRFPSDIRQR